MRTGQIPYLECKGEGCHRTIWLPRSSQLGRFPNRQNSDIDLVEEIYVCPGGVHVCGYKESNVRWSQPPHDIPDNLWELSADAIAFRCEHESSGVLVLVRKTTDAAQPDASRLWKESESWVLEARCVCGRPLRRIPPDSPVVRVSIP